MSTVAEIRNSTVSLLVEANIASGKVFNSKVLPSAFDNAPMVNVYVDKVQMAQQSPHVPCFVSTASVQIDVLVKMTSTWADSADALVQSILDTLMNNQTWVTQFSLIDGVQVSYQAIIDENGKSAVAGLAQITIIGKVFKAY